MSLKNMGLCIIILALAAVVAACDEPGSLQTETKSVALEGAARAEISLNMGAGELRVRGAEQEALLEGSFEFNRERLRPKIDYSRFEDKGILHVGHARRNSIPFGRVRNRWDLSLSKAVPLDLSIDLGAGESDIDLRGLDLQRVDIDMGVGEVKLNLQGPHGRSFNVKIDGGVGSGKIYLPSEVGVRVKVSGGIGSVDAHGLTKQSGVWINGAYGTSPVTVEVDIDAGIGSLDLRCESPNRIRT
jgi:hypothetical protein